MSYSDDIHKMAALCRTDPAFIDGIRVALRDSGLADMCGFTPPPIAVEGPPPPFPDANRVTAVQTSIFDNWPTGKPVKGIPSRYGVAVELWTMDADNILIKKGLRANFEFKSQMALMDSANLKRQVRDIRRKARRHPVCPDYLDALDTLADTIRDTEYRVGMINTNITDDTSGYDQGRYYHAGQFILVEMQGEEVVSAVLELGNDGGDRMTLAPFADRDAGGNPFTAKSKVIAQSRHDASLCMSGSWPTNIS